jgi:hypothetical protein
MKCFILGVAFAAIGIGMAFLFSNVGGTVLQVEGSTYGDNLEYFSRNVMMYGSGILAVIVNHQTQILSLY